MNPQLAGKKIFITGGTSRLGQAFVLKALEGGAKVFFTYHESRETADALEKKGAKGFRLDLTDMRRIDEIAKEMKLESPALDVLIHNAAAVRDHSLQNLTEEEWDYVMTADLKAPYYLTKQLLPNLFKVSKIDKMKTAKIFFITSRAAVVGSFGISNYAAAKAGLIGLAKSLAQELGKKNILVNAVNPGFMKSRMTENLPDDVLQKNLEASPVGRFSEPEEVANFLVYLSSEAMTQVTGQVLHFESRKI